MKNKFNQIFKNFSYAISSNLISMLISALVTLIVPKAIGIEDYGYWQVYLFYASYVGFLHFGWNDGIYLKYGGVKYENLDKKNLFSQFWLLTIFQFLIALVGIILINIFMSKVEYLFIYNMILLNLLFVNTRYFLVYTLQASGRIKDYSKSTIIDRVIYFIFTITLIFLGIKEFRVLIFADLIGKAVSLIYTMLTCKEIVFRKMSDFYFNYIDILDNVNSGIKLMFANIASSLIVGVIKFGIERSWDVSTFGKVSLTLSISNLLMRFIVTLSLVIYPLLRRVSKNQLAEIYQMIRSILSIVLFGVLLFYYPLKQILSNWLPDFSESLNYMALVFPMIIYEGKVSLLTNTYLKTLREEKVMLKVNIITVFISVILTIFTTIVFRNIIFAMLSIVVLIAIKSIIAEKYLSNLLNIKLTKDIIIETIITIIFIVLAWYVSFEIGVFTYLLIYILYLCFKKKELLNIKNKITLLLKVENK